ncbi:MAG TPA: TlpA disulfide reductase family protein [Gaiellaceae bacterium]|nr:TlpA disulfide reductase family protein [Gaiellaceae bacterium]
MTNRRILVAAVILALAGLAGSFAAGRMLADGSGAAAASTVESGTVEVPLRAPAIEGSDPLAGGTVSLARVKKLVVLTVWASWCGPCARGADALRDFARRHRDDVAVIGLDLQDEPTDARAFYERHGWTFPSIRDADGAFAAALGVGDLPTTFFIGRGRLIQARLDGPASRDDLEAALAEARG